MGSSAPLETMPQKAVVDETLHKKKRRESEYSERMLISLKLPQLEKFFFVGIWDVPSHCSYGDESASLYQGLSAAVVSNTVERAPRYAPLMSEIAHYFIRNVHDLVSTMWRRPSRSLRNSCSRSEIVIHGWGQECPVPSGCAVIGRISR